MDIWVVSNFSYNKYSCYQHLRIGVRVAIISFLLGKNLGVVSLGHVVNAHLTFKEIAKTVFQTGHTILCSQQQRVRILVAIGAGCSLLSFFLCVPEKHRGRRFHGRRESMWNKAEEQ